MVHVAAVYNPQIIVLSIGIAFIGSYITICLAEQFRICSGENRPKILNRQGLLCMMAFSLGGVGIWGMHFVGMSAMSLKSPEGDNIDIKFHVFPTILSLVFVVLFCYCGLYVSSQDVVFTKNKTEIVEMFVQNADEMSRRQIRNIHVSHIIRIIATQSLQHLIVGGLITGSGVVCMHYVGMWGMEFRGTIVWDMGIIAASIVIALVASTAAFWILFRLLSLYPNKEILRLVSAVIMAIAVSGMHYSGMVAGCWNYHDSHYSVEDNLDSMGVISARDAFNGALIASVLFVFVLVILALADLRAWLYTTSIQLERAETLLFKINDNCYSNAISNYIAKKKRFCEVNNGGDGFDKNRYLSRYSSIVVPTDDNGNMELPVYLQGVNSSTNNSNGNSNENSRKDHSYSKNSGEGKTEQNSFLSPVPSPTKRTTPPSTSLHGAISEYRVRAVTAATSVQQPSAGAGSGSAAPTNAGAAVGLVTPMEMV